MEFDFDGHVIAVYRFWGGCQALSGRDYDIKLNLKHCRSVEAYK